MRAVNGYLENGRFTPLEVIKLPKRVSAVLVFNEISVDDEKKNVWRGKKFSRSSKGSRRGRNARLSTDMFKS